MESENLSIKCITLHSTPQFLTEVTNCLLLVDQLENISFNAQNCFRLDKIIMMIVALV